MEKNKETLRKRGAQLVAAITLGSIGIAGCSSAEIIPNRRATVVEHQYDDPDTRVVSVKPPAILNEPERFLLVLEQCDRDDEFANEKGCVVDTVEVSEETYNAFEDGETIILEEE